MNAHENKQSNAMVWRTIFIFGAIGSVLASIKIAGVILREEPVQEAGIFLAVSLIFLVLGTYFENRIHPEQRENERLQRDQKQSNIKSLREFIVLVLVFIGLLIVNGLLSKPGDGGIVMLFLSPFLLFIPIRGIFLLARIISDSYYRKRHSIRE